jgi:hypothetical protein
MSFIINADDEATRKYSHIIMRDDAKFTIANSAWDTEYLLLHGGNTYIKNGVITIAGQTITPITSHQSLANYVTTVKVGTTAYSPSSGVVSLPAYPEVM